MATLDGVNPLLVQRFLALQAEAARFGHRIGVTSGFRSRSQQEALRTQNGCPGVYTGRASECRVPTAIPGTSHHEFGLAIDISGSKAAKQWVAQNAARFGLGLPVGGEDWHLEMIGDDAKGFYQGAQQMGGIGFDIDWQQKGLSPEDAQDMLVQSYVDVIGGAMNDEMAVASPATDLVASPAPPEIASPGLAEDFSVVNQPEPPGQVGTSTMTIGGQAPSAGVAQGAQWAGNVPPPGYVPPGSGVERWRDVAIAALNYTGQDPALVGLLLKRMGQESSGNPTAVNNWDVNAQRGDPSKGLMQNIGSAFPQRARELANRGIYDGFANIVASIRYTLNRYGSLTKGWGRPGGY